VYLDHARDYSRITSSQALVHVESFFKDIQKVLDEGERSIGSGDVLTDFVNQPEGVVRWVSPFTSTGCISLILLESGDGLIVSRYGFYTNSTIFRLAAGLFLSGKFTALGSTGTFTIRPESHPHLIVSQQTIPVQYDFFQRNYYTDLKTNGRKWTPPEVSYFDPLVTMITGIPIFDSPQNQTVIGVYCLVFFVDDVSAYLRAIQFGGSVVLTDAHTGRFLGGNFPDHGTRCPPFGVFCSCGCPVRPVRIEPSTYFCYPIG
jgi:hypothetical protein